MSDTSTATEGGTADSAATTDPGTANPATETKTLGAAGEKALEAWKERAKSAESTLKEAQKAATERDALQAKLAEYEEATKSEQEKALDKARKEALAQGKSEAEQSWAARVIKSDVKAAAREKLADPSDALAFLDLDQFKVNENGDTDEKAINAALDQLLKEKPHLGKEQKSTVGSADQGARGTGTRSTDMNSLLRNAIAGKR